MKMHLYAEENASLTWLAFTIIIELALKFKKWAPTLTLHASQKHPRVDGWLFVRIAPITPLAC